MEKQSSNALAIAKFLESHPKVIKTNYPGLPSHPGHETAKKQMRNFGGMVSFEVAGGLEAGKQLVEVKHSHCLIIPMHVGRLLCCFVCSTVPDSFVLI
jgi:cystathionine beta-lyase/cystathionine gamma-synthase